MTRIGNNLDYIDWRKASGGTVEIMDIAVNSDRRKGIGRSLVSQLMKCFAPEVRVWAITRAENIIAQKFYEALQFDAIPLRRFYSSEKNIDAVMYIRSAGGPV